MINDIGEIALSNANDANIPVNCFLSEPDDEFPVWRWAADNFMPRKGLVAESQYLIEADTKEEIIEYVKRYVVPLYRVATHNLETFGENYYWHRREE